MTDTRHEQLGDFLRSRRARLAPADVGIRDARRRRTPGLRREEVATRAGIGVDWYVRLEQGRSVSPSVTTVDALARALKLDTAEHAHLRALVRRADHRAFAIETVPATLRRVVEGLDQPAYVTGRRWDILAWNAAADALFGFAAMPAADRNVLIAMFTLPQSRIVFGDGWADEARRMLAQFRSTHDLWAGDPAFAALVARLHDASAEFADWWAAHDIRATASGEKTLFPPAGRRRYEFATFQANDDPALKLAIYAPLG
jgi:transcriptional regulator with XRE-family HTH domain